MSLNLSELLDSSQVLSARIQEAEEQVAIWDSRASAMRHTRKLQELTIRAMLGGDTDVCVECAKEFARCELIAEENDDLICQNCDRIIQLDS